MTETEPKPEIVQTYEKVACPYCGADRRMQCASPVSGRKSSWPHAARIREAGNQGLLANDAATGEGSRP